MSCKTSGGKVSQAKDCIKTKAIQKNTKLLIEMYIIVCPNNSADLALMTISVQTAGEKIVEKKALVSHTE